MFILFGCLQEYFPLWFLAIRWYKMICIRRTTQMCTFVNLGSAHPSAQGCIVFVLGKARSGVISLLTASVFLSIWSHWQVGASLSLCVHSVFGTVVFTTNIRLWLCVWNVFMQSLGVFKILQIFSLCCLFQYMLSVLGTIIQCESCCGSIVLVTVVFLCSNYCGGALILKGIAVKVLDALSYVWQRRYPSFVY